MPPKGHGAPPKGGAKLGGKKHKKDETQHHQQQLLAVNQEEEDFYREPIKRIVRPDNQLQLSDHQLEEEFTRVLTANDPNVPNNITKYNYKDKAYKQDPEGPMDHLVFHFQMDGCSLHKDGEDAQQQQQLEDGKKMEAGCRRRCLSSNLIKSRGHLGCLLRVQTSASGSTRCRP